MKKIYFVEASFSGAGTVSVINADGSDKIMLVSGEHVVEPDCAEVDLSGGKVYWGNMGPGGSADKSVAPDDGSIMKADLDGKNVETVVPVGITTTPKQIALDIAGGKIYWSDRGDVGDKQGNPKIMRANLDGSSVETIVSTDLKSPVGIALDTAKGKVYFTDRYNNNIKRANLDGTNIEVVVKNTDYLVDLAFDLHKRHLYWTARQEGAVYRADMDNKNTDGAGLKPLVTGLETPHRYGA